MPPTAYTVRYNNVPTKARTKTASFLFPLCVCRRTGVQAMRPHLRSIQYPPPEATGNCKPPKPRFSTKHAGHRNAKRHRRKSRPQPHAFTAACFPTSLMSSCAVKVSRHFSRESGLASKSETNGHPMSATEAWGAVRGEGGCGMFFGVVVVVVCLILLLASLPKGHQPTLFMWRLPSSVRAVTCVPTLMTLMCQSTPTESPALTGHGWSSGLMKHPTHPSVHLQREHAYPLLSTRRSRNPHRFTSPAATHADVARTVRGQSRSSPVPMHGCTPPKSSWPPASPLWPPFLW